jgi:transcriptional regulator with XRE-family HTH domain
VGLSQAQLARRADTSVPTVSRYENGWSRFEVATLRKLATALGCVLVVKLEPKAQTVDRAAVNDVVQKLRRLFWDHRLTPEHLAENTLWVVERVLEYGDLDDVRVLIAALGRDEFLAHVSQARMSSERARTFWRNMLDKEGMTFTTRFSREEASTSRRSSSP